MFGTCPIVVSTVQKAIHSLADVVAHPQPCSESSQMCAVQCAELPSRSSSGRYNGFARAGKDEDFGRGETPFEVQWHYDHSDGETPNPTMCPRRQPFAQARALDPELALRTLVDASFATFLVLFIRV